MAGEKIQGCGSRLVLHTHPLAHVLHGGRAGLDEVDRLRRLLSMIGLRAAGEEPRTRISQAAAAQRAVCRLSCGREGQLSEVAAEQRAFPVLGRGAARASKKLDRRCAACRMPAVGARCRRHASPQGRGMGRGRG